MPQQNDDGLIRGTPIESGTSPRQETPADDEIIRGAATTGSAEDPGLAGYRARVEKYRPEAMKIAKEEPAIMRYLPADVPIVSPLFRWGYTNALAGLGYGDGENYGERQANLMAGSEALREERARMSPVGKAVGEITTGVATLPLMPGSKVAAPAKEAVVTTIDKAKDVLARMGQSGVIGGATSIAERRPGETPTETAERTAMGTATGAILPPVITGASKAIGYVGRPVVNTLQSLWNPQGVLERKIVTGAEKAASARPSARGMTIEEFKQAADEGRPVRPIDIHGVNEQVSRAGGRFPTDERFSEINDFLQDRLRGQTQRIHKDVDDAFGKVIDPIARRAEADEAARLQNRPAYDAAYRAPDAQSYWSPSVQDALNTNEGKEAIKWAANESAKWAQQRGTRGPQNPFQMDKEGNLILDQNGNVQFKDGLRGASLEFLDYVRRGLTTIGRQQPADQGSSTRGMAGALGNELGTMFTAYKDAVTGAGKFIRGNNAFDAGNEFMNLAMEGRGPAAREFNRQWGIFRSQKFTPAEREAFQEGIGAWIKENPEAAAKLFVKGDKAYMGPIRGILGADKFANLDTSLSVNRIMAMNKAIAAKESTADNMFKNVKPLEAAGALAAGKLALDNVPQLAQMANTPGGILTGTAALTAGVLHRIAGSRQMSQLLDMAISDDPAMQQRLYDLARKQSSTQKALKVLEERLANYLAAKAPAWQEESGMMPARPTRATGGRVSDRLVAEVDRAKKRINNQTEELLKTPDTHVAQALEVANRHLEG